MNITTPRVAIASILAIAAGSPASGQQARQLTQTDLEQVHTITTAELDDYYLVRTNALEQLDGACYRLTPTESVGEYLSDLTTVSITDRSLIVRTPAFERNVVSEEVAGYRHCLKETVVRSDTPAVLNRSFLSPNIIQFRLAEETCYRENFYTNCTLKCTHSASRGTPYHFIVRGREQAEEIAGKRCTR